MTLRRARRFKYKLRYKNQSTKSRFQVYKCRCKYETIWMRMTLRRARRWERGWWWQIWEGAPHRQSEAKTDDHIFYGAGIRFLWSTLFFIEFSCSKSATSFRMYCNECNVHNYTFFLVFFHQYPKNPFFYPDLIFVIFLHKCTFWAQYFFHMNRVNCGKISQNVPKFPKIPSKFPKISQHDNFFSTNIICDIFGKYELCLMTLFILRFDCMTGAAFDEIH